MLNSNFCFGMHFYPVGRCLNSYVLLCISSEFFAQNDLIETLCVDIFYNYHNMYETCLF